MKFMISINKILIIMMLFAVNIVATDKILGKLDGAEVSALEISLPEDSNAINVGMDFLPLNPYYNGIGAFLGYQYYITKNSSWEVIRAAYIYSIETNLTSQLADNFGVAPKTIDRLFLMIKSNYKYYLSYGKSLLFDKHINLFRVGFIAGPGLAFSKKRSIVSNENVYTPSFLITLGLVVEVYTSNHLLWYVEFQNSITVKKDWVTHPSFTLGLKKMF
jgi:hypothetical protein